MSGFLFAFMATLLATFGARDQVMVAHLARVQGARPVLLVTALVATGLSTGVAAWLAGRMAHGMVPDARALFGALALLIGGGEMLVLGPRKAAAEPTHSLFAVLVVLLAQQLTDAARFLVLALGVGTAAWLTAGVGGVLGSGVAIAAGWAMPDLAEAAGLRIWRRVAGAVLLVIGVVVGGRVLIA